MRILAPIYWDLTCVFSEKENCLPPEHLNLIEVFNVCPEPFFSNVQYSNDFIEDWALHFCKEIVNQHQDVFYCVLWTTERYLTIKEAYSLPKRGCERIVSWCRDTFNKLI